MPHQKLFILNLIFCFGIKIHYIFFLSSSLVYALHLLIKGWQGKFTQWEHFKLISKCQQRSLLIFLCHFIKLSKKCYWLKIVEFVFVLVLSHVQIKQFITLHIQTLLFIYHNIMRSLLLVLAFTFTWSAIGASAGHVIEAEYTQPHDRNCYSQGLFFLNQTFLFETCGLYNKSYFHVMEYKADPFTLKQVFSTEVPWKLNIFLEGAILFKNFIYILTWRERVVYKLEPETYKLVKEIPWKRDGWGLTQNGTHMFTTDGSDTIFLVDQNFEIVGQKTIVTQMGRKLRNINQLEYVDGYIYANIYLDTKIVKIDYERGKCVTEYDGSKLTRAENKTGGQIVLKIDEVINGIAYDKKNDKFLLTGKHWGTVYLVSL